MTFPKHESIAFRERIAAVSEVVGYPPNVVRNVLREDYKLRRTRGFPKERSPFEKNPKIPQAKWQRNEYRTSDKPSF